MSIFYFTAKDLQLKPDNARNWLTFLEQNDGKKLVGNFGLDKAKRSLDQNALYHLYLDVIAAESGHEHEELHRIFKGLFLPKKKVILKGKEYILAGSTTDLNKPAFSDYMDKICSETSIPIPEEKRASEVIDYPVEDNQTAF